MWISRREWEDTTRLAKSRQISETDLADLHAKLLSTTEQLAALRSTFAWLTEHVNRLERERAILFQRVLLLNVPAMELSRAQSEPPTPGENRIVGKPIEDQYDHTVPGAQALSIFEDVGDQTAALMGIQHDDMGNVRWTK